MIFLLPLLQYIVLYQNKLYYFDLVLICNCQVFFIKNNKLGSRRPLIIIEKYIYVFLHPKFKIKKINNGWRCNKYCI